MLGIYVYLQAIGRQMSPQGGQAVRHVPTLDHAKNHHLLLYSLLNKNKVERIVITSFPLLNDDEKD